MRLLLEPQAKYRPTSHKPSRPYLRRDSKRKRLILQVISDTETPNNPIENNQPPSSPPFGSGSNPKSTMSVFTRSSTTKTTYNLNDRETGESTETPDYSIIDTTKVPTHNLVANLNAEASRLEIGLLALGVLLLVAQMGALIWLGVRRRRRSALWHRDGDQMQQEDGDSRFSSTAGLLFRGPEGAGVPSFLGNRGSSWGWLRGKGKLRGGGGGGVKTGGSVGGSCLFDEVFPVGGGEGSGSDLGGEGGGANGNAGHHHGLVLGPPTVIPVISSALPAGSATATATATTATVTATVTAAVSGLMEGFRRRSSAIWAENIVPPVQVHMDVLMEIGRRVSSGLQAVGAGVVLGGAGKGDGGYKKDEGSGGYGYADEDLSDSHSMTPPEERYHKDLEGGIGPLSLTAGGGVTAATSSDANDNRRFSLMPGLVSVSGGGLVRRAGIQVDKRVSFVEGLVSTPRGGRSGSGGALLGKRRRHSSFVFERRGEVVGDVEGGGDGYDEEALEYEERVMGRGVV